MVGDRVSRNVLLSALAVALILVFVAAPGDAYGTTMYRFSLSELTYVADLIVEAEVESSTPEKAPGARYIKTVASLRLTRVVKGSLIEGDRILVREWGGSLDGENTHVEAAPVYVPGERVLVFLERERLGSMWRTVGMAQGKMTLVEEQDTGRDVTLRLRMTRSVERFDEARVQLPAARRYSADLLARIRNDLDLDYVPPYQDIPGLPAEKDRGFFEAALAAGQQLDRRWPQFRAMEARR
jgi:hypothetical protein